MTGMKIYTWQGMWFKKKKKDLIIFLIIKNYSEITALMHRFLRPPVGPPNKWYNRVETVYKEKIGDHLQDELGTRGQIPTKTFLAAHDRGIALQCKHFMEVGYFG